MAKIDRTPLLFVGHGNPMNAIEDNRYSRKWKEIGKEIKLPKAIVCMSAHWLTSGSFITSNQEPEIIYDFYGFPESLYHVQYPVKGDPNTARMIHHKVPSITQDNQWGIDHGAWSVLRRMFPEADIPVLQISIDYAHQPQEQVELLRQLRQLRHEGILFIGSGNIVHNLGMMRMDNQPYDWAVEFEGIAKQYITEGNIKMLLHYEKLGKSAALSIPTDDHYRPMLNTLALAEEGEQPVFFNDGIDLGSVSMLSFIYNPL